MVGFSIKTIFPSRRIPVTKRKQSWDHLISTIGTSVLVNEDLYIELAPRPPVLVNYTDITVQPFVQQLIHANNKKSTKAPHSWPFVRGSHHTTPSPTSQNVFLYHDIIIWLSTKFLCCLFYMISYLHDSSSNMVPQTLIPDTLWWFHEGKQPQLKSLCCDRSRNWHQSLSWYLWYYWVSLVHNSQCVRFGVIPLTVKQKGYFFSCD